MRSRRAAAGSSPRPCCPGRYRQSTVFAFNLFDEAWILNGSSLDTRTIVAEVYMAAFQNLHFSYGMALSVLVMLASLAVSLVYVLRVYRETRYE